MILRKLRSLVASLGFAFAMGLSPAANAGIPVIDAANLAEAVEQVVAWAKQYDQMITQIMHLRNQYNQLVTTYKSITGTRGIASMMNTFADKDLRRYLPEGADEIASLASGAVAGYSALQTRVSALKSVVSSMPAGSFPGGGEALNVLSIRINSLASQKAIGEAIYSSVKQRSLDIEKLIDKAGTAFDSKDIAEAQARIAAQQTIIQNESTKLQALAYMQQSQQQENAQRANEVIGRWGSHALPVVLY